MLSVFQGSKDRWISVFRTIASLNIEDKRRGLISAPRPLESLLLCIHLFLYALGEGFLFQAFADEPLSHDSRQDGLPIRPF